jgi:hypothetical protein
LEGWTKSCLGKIASAINPLASIEKCSVIQCSVVQLLSPY